MANTHTHRHTVAENTKWKENKYRAKLSHWLHLIQSVEQYENMHTYQLWENKSTFTRTGIEGDPIWTKWILWINDVYKTAIFNEFTAFTSIEMSD